MTDAVTSHNIDLSSWNILYVIHDELWSISTPNFTPIHTSTKRNAKEYSRMTVMFFFYILQKLSWKRVHFFEAWLIRYKDSFTSNLPITVDHPLTAPYSCHRRYVVSILTSPLNNKLQDPMYYRFRQHNSYINCVNLYCFYFTTRFDHLGHHEVNHFIGLVLTFLRFFNASK
jgi:hypothetical protein